MTTGTGTGGSGTGSGPCRLVQIWDAIGDAVWSFQVTFASLWQRWSR